jgi:hypothetical protein
MPVGKGRYLQRPTLHWMIDDRYSDKRVVDYWPSGGVWRSQSHHGVEPDPREIVGIALTEAT